MRALRGGTLGESPPEGRVRGVPTCHPERPVQADGLCKECYQAKWRQDHQEERREYMRRWRAENADKVRQYKKGHPDDPEVKRQRSRERYAANPSRARAVNLRLKYGITVEEYEALLAAQAGLCAICKTSAERRLLDVDHDHATGRKRGLLCNSCNRGLGQFKDNPTLLLAAAAYLEAHLNDRAQGEEVKN